MYTSISSALNITILQMLFEPKTGEKGLCVVPNTLRDPPSDFNATV